MQAAFKDHLPSKNTSHEPAKRITPTNISICVVLRNSGIRSALKCKATAMSLRQTFGTVLKRLRSLRAISQHDFTNLSQSQISNLEAGQSSASLDSVHLIAKNLKINPATLVVVTCAAERKLTPGELLDEVREELEALKLLDSTIEEDDARSPHPNATRAQKIRIKVQELKALGIGPTEVSRRLDIHVSTVKRHWNASE